MHRAYCIIIRTGLELLLKKGAALDSDNAGAPEVPEAREDGDSAGMKEHVLMMLSGRNGVSKAIGRSRRGWRKRISDNVAGALYLFVMWHIALTGQFLRSEGLFPVFCLCVVSGLMLRSAANIDRRWETLEKSDLSAHELQICFRFDVFKIWIAAIVVPMVCVQIVRLAS
jgi:hypothetical protein